MYLRRHRKKSGGVCYETWTLVETVRTIRGPRQRIVATIGKLPGLDVEEKVGWEEIRRILNGQPRSALSLLAQDPDIPEWATVNLRGVQVERLRHFGDVYLGLALWYRLGLMEFCSAQIPEGWEEVRPGVEVKLAASPEGTNETFVLCLVREAYRLVRSGTGRPPRTRLEPHST